jgi:hypothetical protein
MPWLAFNSILSLARCHVHEAMSRAIAGEPSVAYPLARRSRYRTRRLESVVTHARATNSAEFADNPQIGLLAELADAVDSKSKSHPQNTPVNIDDQQKTPPALRRRCATDAPGDPELAEVVKAWPALPAPIRAAMLAMIRAK